LRDLALDPEQFMATSFSSKDQNLAQTDIQLQHQSGRVLTIKLMMQRFSQEGQPDQLLATFDDVTEKRQLYADLNRSHQQLLQNSQQLDAILAASSTVLHRIELDGSQCRTSWVSSNIERIFGYSVEQSLLEQWWEKGVHPDDKARAELAIKQTLLHGHYRHEYRFLMPLAIYVLFGMTCVYYLSSQKGGSILSELWLILLSSGKPDWSRRPAAIS